MKGKSNISVIEMAEAKAKQLFAAMRKGDTRCRFPLESSVMKISQDDGDTHPIGTKGIVKGSLYIASYPKGKEEVYAVSWEGEKYITQCVGEKLGPAL